jgi:hypothetical protein
VVGAVCFGVVVVVVAALLLPLVLHLVRLPQPATRSAAAFWIAPEMLE